MMRISEVICLETERLRQLEAVARLGTVSAAARELHLSQPALSRSIARLEQDLGVELLERSGRRVGIGRAGMVALEYARPMLHEEWLMRQALDELVGEGSSVTIGSIAPAPLRVLVSSLLSERSDLRLATTSLKAEEVSSALLNGRVNLAIGLESDRLPAFEGQPFMTERLAVSLPDDHRLARLAEVSFADLDGETFLLQAHVGYWRAMVERTMPRSRFLMQENRDVYLELAKTSRAAFFVSDAGASNASGSNRVVIPISDAEANPTYWLLMRDDARSEVRDLFALVVPALLEDA